MNQLSRDPRPSGAAAPSAPSVLAQVRQAGVLAHVTTVPGGTIGGDARRFVDWLAEAGVSWWQVLPLGPPDGYGSPYRSRSAFAGWPGLLERPDAPVSLGEEDELRSREASWIGEWERLAGGREAVRDQVRFDREWRALRHHAHERGVALIGDVPIYVAWGGVDHRAHPELFRSGHVAGVPPDAFSDTGQRWGNPLYDWPALRATGYRWWIERLRRTFDLVDLTRIDHFRGFVAYWEVPEECPTAVDGRWVRGPGRALFDAATAELGPLPVIAEDLGVITAPVIRLRDELGFPGMAVLQFAFDGPRPTRSPHHPRNHRRNSVCYVGTHDNDTALGWWESIPDPVRRQVIDAASEAGVVGSGDDEPWWMLVRLALSSRAQLAVVQLQDVLGLGSEARMNVPGRDTGNWRWQAQPEQLTSGTARRLRSAIEAAGRLPTG